MSGQQSRPVPAVDGLTREFWTGGGHGELRITNCRVCGRLFHPPASVCPNCFSREITHESVPATGVVDSFTVVRRPWIPGYDTPYVVARVRLREQPDVLLVSNVVGCPPEDVYIGMTVSAVFEARGEVQVPMFRPAS